MIQPKQTIFSRRGSVKVELGKKVPFVPSWSFHKFPGIAVVVVKEVEVMIDKNVLAGTVSALDFSRNLRFAPAHIST